NQMVKYGLYKDYHTNFDADRENGSEWVWGVQHSANDGLPGVNPANASHDMVYISTQNSATGGRGYGFFTPTHWFVAHFRVDENGLPFVGDANPRVVKNDEGLSSVDPFTPETDPLDPRLDWTVGRRGIPFLDYGIMPGRNWIRDQASSGPYMSKKFFTLGKDNGKYTAGRTNNALNIALIRYSDVILMAAEAEARVGNLDRARILVNMVRNRMATNTNSPENWVKKLDGTNAANYMIGTYPAGSATFSTRQNALQAILHERLLELGLEGHSAYDVVRFGMADNNATVVSYFNAFLNYEARFRGYLNGARYSKEKGIIPIPQKAIDNSVLDGKVTLKQNPGY
ncbi:RagB/SusD family nutrient uptake outer membrane protein, partial [Pedobacter sp.]|uniref:RagB/SusD family nutrient uptake outer membrane protein n=1 Tax=Pedobacter sp. TaxID=1411316 RepID=UPI003D7FF35D